MWYSNFNIDILIIISTEALGSNGKIRSKGANVSPTMLYSVLRIVRPSQGPKGMLFVKIIISY